MTATFTRKIRGSRFVVQAPQYLNRAFEKVGAAKRMIAMGNAMLVRRRSSGLPGAVFPTEANQKKCRRGYKVFCCEAGDWSDVISGC